MNADKTLVSRRFEQALETYEGHAQVQALVADALLRDVQRILPDIHPSSALEIGCCTGLMTEKIVAQHASLTHLAVCDLVSSFQRCIYERSQAQGWQPQVSFLAGDIETLNLPKRYDLILSSSTLHWVHDFPRLAAKLGRHLNPGGVLAISLYGPDNFKEIREITGTGLTYRSITELSDILGQFFQLLLIKERKEQLFFADPLAVLRHLQATGVNGLTKQVWSKGRLSDFAKEYTKRFSTAEGVVLTYHPLYFVATSPEVLHASLSSSANFKQCSTT